MFGLTKKVESKEINEAYQEFLDNPDIILLNADEYRDFETLHIVDSQNLPLRVINSDAGSLTVVSIFSLTKSLKTLIISMLLSFFIVKFAKLYVVIRRNI